MGWEIISDQRVSVMTPAVLYLDSGLVDLTENL